MLDLLRTATLVVTGRRHVPLNEQLAGTAVGRDPAEQARLAVRVVAGCRERGRFVGTVSCRPHPGERPAADAGW